MSQIHFRRFRPKNDEGWELDCFVLPTDETNGELVHFKLNRIHSFREETEPGLFALLDGLLDRIGTEQDAPKDKVRMVIGRKKDNKENSYSLQASEEYSPSSPSAEIWGVINSVYEKKVKGAGQSQ